MNRIAIAAVALLLSVPARAADSRSGKNATVMSPVHGKPQAPVTVTARLVPGRATVTVRFDSAATDASIEVHGVDGLTVASAPTPLSGGRFGRGESVTFDVALSEPAGRSNLAVTVSATFRGARRSTVASFAVGQPSAGAQKSVGNVTTDSVGQRVKVMPAETR